MEGLGLGFRVEVGSFGLGFKVIDSGSGLAIVGHTNPL